MDKSLKTILIVVALLVAGWFLYKKFGNRLTAKDVRVPAPLVPVDGTPGPGMAMYANPLGSRPTAVPLGGAAPPPKKLATAVLSVAVPVAASNVRNVMGSAPVVDLPINIIGSTAWNAAHAAPPPTAAPVRTATPPPSRVLGPLPLVR